MQLRAQQFIQSTCQVISTLLSKFNKLSKMRFSLKKQFHYLEKQVFTCHELPSFVGTFSKMQ